MQELPTEILKFTDLKVLDLHHNRIQSLPNEISELKSLEKLDLSRNKLKQIPDIFDSLPNLKDVNLKSNQLTTIPNSLLRSTSVNHIDLSDNLLRLHANDFRSIDTEVELDLPSYMILTDNPEFDSGDFSNLQLHHSRLYDGVTIVSTDALTDTEWLSPRLFQYIQSVDQIDFETEITSERWKAQVNTMLTSTDEKVKEVGQVFYDFLLANEKLQLEEDKKSLAETIDETVDQKIQETKSNWPFFLYILLGALMITVITNYLDNIGWITTLPLFEVAVLVYFVFQIYQGLTIKQYADDLIGKVESAVLLVQKQDNIPLIPSLLKYIATKLRSSLGVLITIFWVLSIVGLENTVIDTTEYEFSIPLASQVAQSLSQLPSLFDQFNIDLVFPSFSIISLSLFSGFGGILLRVIGIFTVFYAVFQGGWKVIIHPSQIEDRSKGAKLDWYEVLALPIGVIVGFVAILIDNTEISVLPIIIFQVGLFIGGILYFIYSKNDRLQMAVTLLTMAAIGAIPIIYSIPYNLDITTVIVSQIPIIDSFEWRLNIITVILLGISFGLWLAFDPSPESSLGDIDSFYVRLVLGSIQGLVMAFTFGVFFVILHAPLKFVLDLFSLPLPFQQDYFFAPHALVLGMLFLWYFPKKNGISLLQILGRPMVEGQEPSNRWTAIATNVGLHQNRSGLLTSIGNESKFEIMKTWDLGSVVFILLIYIVIPVILWKLLFYIPVFINGLLIILGTYLKMRGSDR